MTEAIFTVQFFPWNLTVFAFPFSKGTMRNEKKPETASVCLKLASAGPENIVQIIFWEGHGGNSNSQSLFAEFIFCLLATFTNHFLH